MKQGYLILWLAVGFSSITACTRLSSKFDAPQKIGGQWVSARTLNLGHDTYMQYCYQCHGVQGDGNGPAAPGMYPVPRNFTTGLFKFAAVSAGELPRDLDLKHTIKVGLRGTQMLPWDISEERMHAVVQYIKTFSPRWTTDPIGAPLEQSEDPWGVKLTSEAVAQGKKIYHGLAQCYSCHPSYASLSEIDAYSKDLTGNGVSVIRESPHVSIVQDTQHGQKVMPPDFTKTPVKTGGSPATTYQVLNAGLGGTTMAAWKGMLSASGDPADSEKNQWALAYYVQYLQQMRFDNEMRKAFFKELNAKRASDPKPQSATQ